MLNKIRLGILFIAATLSTVIAMSGSSINSMWLIYEPDIPKSIRKDL